MELTTVQQGLERFLASQGRSGINLTIGPMSMGWETQVYHVTGQVQNEPVDMVLRRYCGEHVEPRAVAESFAFRRLGELGYRVPKLYGWTLDRSFLQGPILLMESIYGEDMWGHYRGQLFGPAMMAQFAGLMLQLHRYPLSAFTGEGSPWGQARDAHNTFDLDVLGGLLAQNELLPLFQPILQKLKTEEPKVGHERRALIHGDFHPANILINREGQPVILDWGAATIDDPRVDLAQSAVLAATDYRPEAAPIVLAAYEEALGQKVPAYEWFFTLALARRVMVVTIVVARGSHVVGLRPGLEVQLRSKAGEIRQMVDFLTMVSGVQLPAVHELLASYEAKE